MVHIIKLNDTFILMQSRMHVLDEVLNVFVACSYLVMHMDVRRYSHC